MGRIREIWREMRVIVAMVVVQTTYAGMNILYKLAADDGTNLNVLVAYRLSFAAIFMLPLALIFQRKKRPEFTWRLLLVAFVSGLLGAALPTTLYLAGLALTSATFSAAASILGPLITLLLTLIFRMETLRLGSKEGRAKLVGTFLGVGGALVFILYKGFEIHVWSTHVDLLKQSHHCRPIAGHHLSLLGVLMIFGSVVSFSLWLLLQAKINKELGGHYWNTSLMNMMGSLVCLIVALSSDREWKHWRLGWNIGLLTTLYSGIVVSGIVVPLVSWCVETKGPLYVTVFSPVRLIIVSLFGSFAFEENIYLGSVMGTVIMVGGVYLVVWCKSKETNNVVETDKDGKDLELTNVNVSALNRDIP